MTDQKITPQERQEASDTLRELFPEGSLATTVLRHVSASGRQREISVIGVSHGEIVLADWLIRRAMDVRIGKHQGIVRRGAGMDMGFDLIYSLSHVLYGDGYAIKQRWL